MASHLVNCQIWTSCLFLCLTLTPLVQSRFLDPSSYPVDLKGQWTTWEKCPPDTYVFGLAISRNSDANFAALRFYCGQVGDKKSDLFYTLNISNTDSETEIQNFTEPIFCERGLGIGVQLQERADTEVQTTSNIALICSDESLLFDEQNLPTGLWSKPNRCNLHEGICATQEEVMTQGSVTLLQSLRFDCCEIPHPAQTCSASDTLEEIAECNNEFGAEKDLTCGYTKRFGISYNDDQQEEHSIYEDLGFDLASAAPFLAAQPDFDPAQGQGQGRGQVSFGLETSSEETVMAQPGSKVTVKQVAGTCGFYTIRTNFTQIHTDQKSAKKSQYKQKSAKPGYYDTEGMQGDFGGWDSEEDNSGGEEVSEWAKEVEKKIETESTDDDDWGKSNEDEIAVPEAAKSEPVTENSAEPIEEEDGWDDDDKEDEVKPEVVPKTEKPAESAVELNEIDDGWADSHEDDKPEVVQTEKPSDADAVKSISATKDDEDEDDWGEDDKDEPETKTQKAIVDVSKTEPEVQHEEKEDDWGESHEDQKPETVEPKTEKSAETVNPETVELKTEKAPDSDAVKSISATEDEDNWDDDDKEEPETKTQKAIVDVSKTEPEVQHREEEDDWGESQEDQKPETVEPKTEKSVEAVKPETAEPKTEKSVETESNTEHNDDDWGESLEDEKTEFREAQTEKLTADIYSPVTKQEADDWDDLHANDLEVKTPVLEPESETVKSSDTETSTILDAETSRTAENSAPVTSSKEEDDGWADSEEHVTAAKTPDVTELSPKIPEVTELSAETPEVNELSPKTPEVTEHSEKTPENDAPNAEPEPNNDDWSSESIQDETESPTVIPVAPVKTVADPENDLWGHDDDLGIDASKVNDADDLLRALEDKEVELIKQSGTESPLQNFRQAPSDDEGWKHADIDSVGEEIHVEIPIVRDLATPPLDQMANDEAAVDDDDWGDEDNEPTPEVNDPETPNVNDPEPEVSDSEPKVNAIQTAKLESDPLGKRAFDFLQTAGNSPPLVDLSSLADNARAVGDQISKDVSTFSVEAQKVIDDVKATPIYQEGQKKVEETLKTVVEAAINASADALDSGVDADYSLANGGGGGIMGEGTTESETEVAFQKAGGFVGYIVGGMVLCVVIIVIVIFIIEKRGNRSSTSGHDPHKKNEYTVNAVPTPEPLISHHAIKIEDTDKYN